MSIMERREAVYKSCSVRIEWFKVIAYTLKCFPDGIDKKLRVLETEKGDSLLCYDVAIKEFDYGFGSWYIDYTWILATKDIICVEYYLIDYIRLLKAIEGHISEHRDSIISKYKGFGYKDAEGVLKEKEELLTREKDRCEKVVCLLKGSSLNTEGHAQGALNKIKENKRDSLPVQFSTDEAKALLDKVIKNGFCDDKYDWKYSKSLLAYFAQKASDKLKLSNKTMSTGQRCVSWKPFEGLFTINGEKVKNLSQASQDIVNKGKPNGHKDIDSLF